MGDLRHAAHGIIGHRAPAACNRFGGLEIRETRLEHLALHVILRLGDKRCAVGPTALLLERPAQSIEEGAAHEIGRQARPARRRADLLSTDHAELSEGGIGDGGDQTIGGCRLGLAAHVSRPLPVRIRVLFSTLSFYFITSIFYYGLVKLSVFFVEMRYGKLESVGIYDVSVQNTPSVVLERILDCLRYFYAMPPLNFEAPAGFAVVLVAVASAIAGFVNYSPDERVRAIVGTVVAFFMNMLVLLASISPWLLSNMNSLATRHLLPWYLFYCASAVGALYTVLSRLLKMKTTWIPVAVLLGVLVPIAVAQYRLSSLEVMVSSLEIQTMRDRISDWVETKGWMNNRYVLVILPTRPRPTVVETLYPNIGSGDINAVLASSQNTVSIPWMLNALLRERHDRPQLLLIDCSSDQACANAAAQDPKVIVLGYTNDVTVISSAVAPFIINLSL